MKIELFIDTPNVGEWFAGAVVGYNAARAKDQAEWDARRASEAETYVMGSAGPAYGHSGEVKTGIEPEAPKEPAKKTRAKKVEEPAPQITTSPEDRKPVEVEAVEQVEEAEIVDVFEEAPAPKVYSRQDVKDAMQVYVAKHGMDALAANAATLLGAKKLSEIPEDAAAFEAAVKRLEAAVA